MVGGSNFIVDCTMTSVGSTFSPASVTVKAYGSPGTLLQLHGMPGAAVAGLVVENVTAGSYAIIDSMAGAVATMTQPYPGSQLFAQSATQTYTEDDSWAAGNTYQLLSMPMLNLKVWDVYGGDSNAGYSAPVAWMQGCWIPDVSGVPGNSVFAPRLVDGNNMTISTSRIDPQFYGVGAGGPFADIAVNLWAPNGVDLVTTDMVGGASNVNASSNGTLFEKLSSVDGDAILHSAVAIKGGLYNIVGLAYADSAITIAHGGVLLIEPDLVSSSAQLWGAATMNLEGPESAVQNGTGGTWASCLTIGTLTLEGSTTGTEYAAGVWTDGRTINSANLDTYVGLQNPRTGSRFSSN